MSIEADMPGRLPRYCVEDVDRHGNVRVYLRRKGWPKVRLQGVPWTEHFMEAYRVALDGTPAVKPRDRHTTLPDTWKWLCEQYVTSARFRGLDVVTQRRRRNSKPMTLEVPVLPVLGAAIEACPNRNSTFLMTERGQPFTSNGFGNWFKDRCREAGLPHCSAHGLRKAGATLAAENGATERQLMAMFGWRTSKMAEHYTRKAEQKRLADGAMHLIDLDQRGSGSVPLFAPRRTSGTFGGKNRNKNKGDFSDWCPGKDWAPRSEKLAKTET